MKLNIIIPTYNRPEYLDRLLTSLFSGMDENVSVWVFDDMSSVSYKKIVSKWGNKIKYYRNQKNNGKNSLLVTAFKQIPDNEQIMIIDDKAIFATPLKTVGLNNIDLPPNCSLCFNLYTKNGDLIGNKFIANRTMYQNYFKSKFKGDKIWIFNKNDINIKEIEKLIISNENNYEDSFWVNQLWNFRILKVYDYREVVWEYLDGGITSKISKIAKENPMVTINVNAIYFKKIKSWKSKLGRVLSLASFFASIRIFKNHSIKEIKSKTIASRTYIFLALLFYIPFLITKKELY
ncbi:MAG: glycosyltransferase [Mycoplasma sp.]